MEKMTKKEMFAQVIALAMGKEVSVPASDIVKFAEHEIALLEKKASHKSDKPSAKQIENEAYKVSILEYLTANGKHTASEIAVAVGVPTNQRCSALLKQMKDNGQIIRTEEKKVAYFGIAE